MYWNPIIIYTPCRLFEKKTAKRDGYDISHEEVDSQRVCFCYDVSFYASMQRCCTLEISKLHAWKPKKKSNSRGARGSLKKKTANIRWKKQTQQCMEEATPL